jgi:voltage-gated potassium channel
VTSQSDISPAQRRKLLAIALIRALGTAVILVTLYYVLPMENVSDAGSIVVLTVGLLAIAIIVVWEVRLILKADYPVIQGIEALAVTVPLFLLLYSTAYFLIENASPSSFSQHLTRTDALYFTVTTFATVGYGDITAKSQGTRVIVIFQMLTDLVVLGFGVRVLVEAVQLSRQRQAQQGSDAPTPSPSGEPEGGPTRSP